MQNRFYEVFDQIVEGLNVRGFHHEPFFASDSAGSEIVKLARQFGPLFVPSGLDPDSPVIVTRPQANALLSRPFDRPEGIGWHNDFSTAQHRPELTFIWVAEADPGGEDLGAWRVASVADLLKELLSQPSGFDFEEDLMRQSLPFGYDGDREPSAYRLLERLPEGGTGLRFYERALRQGAWLRHGYVPSSTSKVVERLTRAADAVGKKIPATKNALLVVNNYLSLHDRIAQTTHGNRARCTILCFVQALKPIIADGSAPSMSDQEG